MKNTLETLVKTLDHSTLREVRDAIGQCAVNRQDYSRPATERKLWQQFETLLREVQQAY